MVNAPNVAMGRGKATGCRPRSCVSAVAAGVHELSRVDEGLALVPQNLGCPFR